MILILLLYNLNALDDSTMYTLLQPSHPCKTPRSIQQLNFRDASSHQLYLSTAELRYHLFALSPTFVFSFSASSAVLLLNCTHPLTHSILLATGTPSSEPPSRVTVPPVQRYLLRYLDALAISSVSPESLTGPYDSF